MAGRPKRAKVSTWKVRNSQVVGLLVRQDELLVTPTTAVSFAESENTHDGPSQGTKRIRGFEDKGYNHDPLKPNKTIKGEGPLPPAWATSKSHHGPKHSKHLAGSLATLSQTFQVLNLKNQDGSKHLRQFATEVDNLYFAFERAMDLASTKKQLAGPSVDSNQGSDGEHSTLSNDHSESSPDEENSTSEDDEGTDSSDDNSDSDADSSSGVRTPELKAHYETNHHRPLSPTKPTPEAGGTKEDETKQEGEKHEEEGDKLDIETIKTQAAKSCEIGKEASRIFHEWGRFEILGRLRDRNVNGPFTEDELVERIWVKDGLQQRWRIYIQTLPFGIGHANRCGLGDCRKKWALDETSSTIIISFEPAQWTQNAKLMETRLEILDSVYEYASLKCDNYEPGKHLDVWNSDVPFNIKETKLDAMENSILDIETHRLPRWEGDDWDELWEPDYVLLGTKFLNDRYGEGKKYCIRCFESLLPPVHSPKPQRKDDDKADVATEKSQKVQSNENTKRQTFQSSNNPTAPTAENKGSSPSSPAPLDQTEPLSLAEAAGDPTINPWLGVYSSVFPDTRGRYALNENIHEMIWLWKDACCGIEITVGEAGEDDDYAEEKEKMKELGKMGLREVLWLTPESWK